MRFTLRWLLLLVSLLAFLAAVCFAFPVWLANMVVAPLPLMLPGVYTVGLIYGPKKTRPFYIGALGTFVLPVILRSWRVNAMFDLYAGPMERIYTLIGQPRTLIDRSVVWATDDGAENYYFVVVLDVLCSVVSGLICLGLASTVWKDRSEA
jgi:hypothetical protein